MAISTKKSAVAHVVSGSVWSHLRTELEVEVPKLEFL